MNILIFSEQDLIASNLIRIADYRAEHLQRINKIKIGDTIKVGLLNGSIGPGIIRNIENIAVEIEFELNQQPPPPLATIAIVALPRPKMIRRILQSVASIGVKELYFINSFNVEKSYWQSPALTNDTIHQYLLSGLEQAIDTHLPKVYLKKLFKPFVEDELPHLVSNKTALLAQPDSSSPCPAHLQSDTVVAIGPERGFIRYEIDKLVDTGFTPVNLGQRVLKVETALTFILGKITA